MLCPDGIHTRLVSNPFQPSGTLRPLSASSRQSTARSKASGVGAVAPVGFLDMCRTYLGLLGYPSPTT